MSIIDLKVFAWEFRTKTGCSDHARGIPQRNSAVLYWKTVLCTRGISHEGRSRTEDSRYWSEEKRRGEARGEMRGIEDIGRKCRVYPHGEERRGSERS